MLNKANYWGIILFAIILPFETLSQRLPTNSCPTFAGSSKAHNKVMFFLTLPDREDKRIQVGATNETVEQIEPVSESIICNELNKIVNNNPKFKAVDHNLDDRRTKYYYQTNNLYYIFWHWKPEDNPENGIRIRTGPKTLFIVVNKDFSEVWEHYF
ncbi:MAG: hypothetical protein AAF620_16700 [Bacteroidota bacterium]